MYHVTIKWRDSVMKEDKFNPLSDKHQQEDGSAGLENDTHKHNATHYYAHGPFQSMDENSVSSSQTGMFDKGGPYTSTSMMSQHSNGNLPGVVHIGNKPKYNVHGNWDLQSSWKNFFKSRFIFFVSGMLVILLLMYIASDQLIFVSKQKPFIGRNDQFSPSTEHPVKRPFGSINRKKTDDIIPDIVEQVGPAVVKITTKGKSSRNGTSYHRHPFFQFFFDNDDVEQRHREETAPVDDLVKIAEGSGFIFDKAGFVLTNEHVIADAVEIEITLDKHKKPYKAKLLGKSRERDLAVLRIEKQSSDQVFPVAELGNSNESRVGEKVIAIGNPGGFEHTVTVGVLSAKDRSVTASGSPGSKSRKYKDLLQTDASINPGNSGGPLLDLQGRVVGMNVVVSADQQGIGFAIPASGMLEVVEDLKNNREIPTKPIPFIGVGLDKLTSNLATQMGVDVKKGIVIKEVYYSSPADKAELRIHDIITRVDNEEIQEVEQFVQWIEQKKIGEKIQLQIVRHDQKKTITVTVGDRNSYEKEEMHRSSTN